MSLFTKDDSQSKIDALVSEVKGSTTLDPESQSPEFSGHESAEYGKGGPSEAGPKGVGESY